MLTNDQIKTIQRYANISKRADDLEKRAFEQVYNTIEVLPCPK